MFACYTCSHNTFLCFTDIFLPTPDSLLVNLNECKEVRDFTWIQSLLWATAWSFKIRFHVFSLLNTMQEWPVLTTIYLNLMSTPQRERKLKSPWLWPPYRWKDDEMRKQVSPRGSGMQPKNKTLSLYLFFSSCRICWKACQLYLKKPWRPSLPWVQLCKRPSSCWCPPEGACLSFRPSCQTLVWGHCSPEKTLTNGHLPR